MKYWLALALIIHSNLAFALDFKDIVNKNYSLFPPDQVRYFIGTYDDKSFNVFSEALDKNGYCEDLITRILSTYPDWNIDSVLLKRIILRSLLTIRLEKNNFPLTTTEFKFFLGDAGLLGESLRQKNKGRETADLFKNIMLTILVANVDRSLSDPRTKAKFGEWLKERSEEFKTWKYRKKVGKIARDFEYSPLLSKLAEFYRNATIGSLVITLIGMVSRKGIESVGISGLLFELFMGLPYLTFKLKTRSEYLKPYREKNFWPVMDACQGLLKTLSEKR